MHTTPLSYRPERRHFLTITTAAAGGLGLVATAVPFIKSMSPSERARAAGAPAELDVSTIAPGSLVTVEWRGKPVWVLHRTSAQLAALGGHDGDLADPQSKEPEQPAYAANATRALNPEFLVLTAICTHLGCIPSYRPDAGAADLGDDWPGGFYCPCHGSKFDLAGRVFRNVPAPRNMEVPSYAFEGSKLVIGIDPTDKAP
ncbi:ubiquinol-cytochrome c reductase iron-sulfur subunit [Massilia cavernae]|uniref:Ubiquinol-cytochrome c reductase iron-sulfur subunit n=1 Tax=Massilia cavernae TaxID=2320864 RepID=A0A418XS81_9BURK|nr:ubiquinol-cytochrome c reductase iron-sulfur subunit [Massilia cavernae]RJG15409.1 ubiquinol-cytochrome c reductase iron-sulfur subunit [Massilia cavernae]